MCLTSGLVSKTGVSIMRLLKWLIILVVLVGSIMGLSPLAAKAYLSFWFESKGYEFELKKLSLDYIFGNIGFSGLSLRSPDGEQLNLFEANFALDIASLMNKQVNIDSIELSNISVDVSSNQGQLTFAGLDFSSFIPSSGDRAWPVNIRTGQFSDIEICQPSIKQCFSTESATLSRVEILSSLQGLDVEFHGPLTVGKTFLKDDSNEISVFYFESFSWEKAYISDVLRKFQNVELRNLQVLVTTEGGSAASAPLQTQLGELKLTQLNIVSGESPRIELGKLDLLSARQVLQKPADGDYLWPKTVQSWFPDLLRFEGAVVFVDGRRATVSWDDLKVRSGVLKWTDFSVTPNSHEIFSQINVHVGSLQSRKPEQKLDIHISSKLGEQGALQLEGFLYPFAEHLDFEISGFINGLNTEHFAAQTREIINQKVNSGVIDVSWQASAQRQRLLADSQWRFSNFDFVPTRNNSRYMPLELSFDLLRDRSNAVDVELAIRQDIGRDPLTISKLFNSLLRSKIHQLAQQKVNPSNAVSISAREKPSFQKVYRPLLYPTQQTLPAALDMERLNEIAEDLKSHQDLTLAFCPIITGGEWAELFNNGIRPQAGTQLTAEQRQQMMDLAVARGQSIRALLIERGVKASQIVICPAAIDMTKFGPSFSSIRL